jgi:hypothetical protein
MRFFNKRSLSKFSSKTFLQQLREVESYKIFMKLLNFNSFIFITLKMGLIS